MVFKRTAILAVLALVLSLGAVPASAIDYTPREGITFNNAYGTREKQKAILSKIFKSIRATPAGGQIEIMTWNFNSNTAIQALDAAQERGVRVRFIQAKGNVGQAGNDAYARLKRVIQDEENALLPNDLRSWVRACRQSCRGQGGAAHAKYFLFSQSGTASKVAIQGSANLTDTSARNQWNDIQTFTDRDGPYEFLRGVFEEMAKDRPVPSPYTSWEEGTDELAFFPLGAHNDPVMQMLNEVRCQGAANTTTGRTRILIAPDVIRESRGLRLSRKIRNLWINGCDVKIGYTVLGGDSGQLLRKPSRRGPVPLAHMVRDSNGDRQFDEYFHLKSMAIIGHVNGDPSGYALINGSQNWSNASARSDENVGIFHREGITKQYAQHISRWYRYFDRRDRNRYAFARQAEADGRLVDGFLVGTGPIDGVDPYANIEMD